MRLKLYSFFLLGLANNTLLAQDPHFTQFNAAPFTVNPAYAGVFNGTLRFMSNYRNQWANLIDPFTTSVVAGDVKVGAFDPTSGQHPFNIGFQLMQDKSMAGAFRSNYGGLVTSYHVKLDQEGTQTLGAGLSFNYGSRRIDFSSISFDRQFTSGGFDLSLPNGESALQNMQPFFSVGAGMLFKLSNPTSGTFFDVGFSGYHFNRPIQTVTSDPNQVLPIRLSGQLNYQQYLNDYSILNLHALFQKQAGVSYLLAGFSLARIIGSGGENLIGAGFYYRTKESISPNTFIEYNNIRVGLSYDIAYNSLRKELTPARSLELSLQWRFGQMFN
jgi:type IX secretion system PorP/SprF family membrane protein